MKTTGIVLLLIGVSNTLGLSDQPLWGGGMTGSALWSLSTSPWVIFLLVAYAPALSLTLPRLLLGAQ